MLDSNPDPAGDPLALLFFAFRAVTAEPDRVLAERGLGRVHHRILYFVARTPGIGPGGLLALLRVSKQALARPLRELLARGLLEATVPSGDRRTRALALTPAGARLEARLSGLQRRRFAAAFGATGPAAERGWREVMSQLSREPRGPPRGGGSRPRGGRPPRR